MNTRAHSRASIVVSGLFAFAALGTGIVAWKLYREVVGLRMASVASADLEAARKRAWEAEQRARELEAALAALRSAPAAPIPPATGRGAAPTPEQQAAAELRRSERAAAEQAERAVLASPQYQRELLAGERAEVEVEYSGLFRQLNLGTGLRERVVGLLVEREQVEDDIEDAAEAQGVDGRGDGLDALVEAARGEIDANLKLLIGDQAFATVEAYRRTMPHREDVNQLQLAVTHAGIPLTSGQVEQLLASIPQAAAQPGGRGGNLNGDIPGGEVSLSRQTLAAARGVLTPAQWQILEQLQLRQQSDEARNRLRDQARVRN